MRFVPKQQLQGKEVDKLSAEKYSEKKSNRDFKLREYLLVVLELEQTCM